MLHPGLTLHNGRYRLVSRLREGASAQVWRALDAREGREVALKAIPLESGGADAAEHEADAAARVKHPGVVRVFGTFEALGHGWVAMELAQCSLADVVDVDGALDGPRTRAVAQALAEVLAATHAAGVVHRDLKPQNVLVLRDGSVRLADFGIARVHARGHSRTAALIGTLPYMAPEQRRDPRDVRPATDVYAWAVLVAWMRTGVAPGELYVPEAIDALRRRLRAAGESDDALLDVIVAAGRYDPADRPRDGEALVERVAGWAGTPAKVGPVDVSDAAGEAAEATLANRAGPVRSGGSGGPTAAIGWVRFVGAIVLGGGVAAAVGMGAAAWRDEAKARAVAVGSSPSAGETPPAELPWCDVSVQGFAHNFATGPRETTAVAAADLDADGFGDALFVNQLDESVTIWWGGPERALGPRQNVPVGRSMYAPVVRDLDGDGVLDLLLSLTDASAFAYVRGLGGREFAKPETVFQGPGPSFVSTFDAADGVHVVFFKGQDLVARRVRFPLPWPEERRLGGLPLSSAGAILREGRDLVFAYSPLATRVGTYVRVGRDLILKERISRPDWPKVNGMFAADLAAPPGEELYGRTDDSRVVRLPLRPDEAVCLVTPAVSDASAFVLAHLDGDGVPDLIEANTCRECTSSQVVGWGG